MFDIAWSELGVIAVVALIVIGPKDLPKVLRSIGQWTAKARAMAREFQSGIDDMVREAELDELRKAAKQVTDFSLENEVKKTFDPDGSLEKQFSEHNKAIMEATGTATPAAETAPAETAAAETVTKIADPGPAPESAPSGVETPAPVTPAGEQNGTPKP